MGNNPQEPVEKSANEREWDEAKKRWKTEEKAAKWPALKTVYLVLLPAGVAFWAIVAYLLLK